MALPLLQRSGALLLLLGLDDCCRGGSRLLCLDLGTGAALALPRRLALRSLLGRISLQPGQPPQSFGRNLPASVPGGFHQAGQLLIRDHLPDQVLPRCRLPHRCPGLLLRDHIGGPFTPALAAHGSRLLGEPCCSLRRQGLQRTAAIDLGRTIISLLNNQHRLTAKPAAQRSKQRLHVSSWSIAPSLG